MLTDEPRTQLAVLRRLAFRRRGRPFVTRFHTPTLPDRRAPRGPAERTGLRLWTPAQRRRCGSRPLMRRAPQKHERRREGSRRRSLQVLVGRSGPPGTSEKDYTARRNSEPVRPRSSDSISAIPGTEMDFGAAASWRPLRFAYRPPEEVPSTAAHAWSASIESGCGGTPARCAPDA